MPQTVTTIGLDIARSVFQVHGVDAEGNVAVRRQLKRRYVLAFFQKLPPCLVGIEACASSHHWSRELPALGHTPVTTATATDVIDTSKGTVHMVIGGGGTSVPSNQLFFNPPQCRVITAVGEPDPATGKRPPVYVKEQAPWSAVRNAAHSYGFAAFTIDPGSHRGDITTIKVTYYDVVGPDGQLAPFETFTLRRPRRD